MGMGCMGGSITDAMLYLCEVSVTRLSREADMSADDACKLHPPSTLTMPMQVGAAPELCVPYTAGQTWARRRVLDECRSERPNTRWGASGIGKGVDRSEAPWIGCTTMILRLPPVQACLRDGCRDAGPAASAALAQLYTCGQRAACRAGRCNAGRTAQALFFRRT